MTWLGSSTLGSTITSRSAPAPVTTATMSRWQNGVSTGFTRTARVGAARPARRVATIASWTPAPFAPGATESSRSRITSSAGSVAAFSSIRGLEPGTT